MTREQKIQTIAQKVRELGEEKNGAQELLLVKLMLEELDLFDKVRLHADGRMQVVGVTMLETEWTKDINDLSDEEIDRTYNAILAHEEWEKKYESLNENQNENEK